MGKKVEEYREILSKHRDRTLYLKQNSGLPGPRCNLELAIAFVQTAGAGIINNFASKSPKEAPENTPEAFLAFCGVMGMGRLVTEGKQKYLKKLRAAASDERWRIREAVAMALQLIGKYDMDRLIRIARKWSAGNCYEQRAAVAGICEPELLWDRRHAKPVFEILDRVTAGIEKNRNCSTEGSRILKKALGYCWSVAVAAFPEEGKPVMENWIGSDHPDVQWIMKENLKKKRLEKMDPEWVEKLSQQ